MEDLSKQIHETQEIMVQNIHRMNQNIENLEVIEGKTQDLKDSSRLFRRSAVQVRRSVCFRHLKLVLAIVGVVLVIIIILVLSLYFHFKQ